ncbi:MAG: hypothetical protein LC791_11410, partial [Acidobacteria bacterium]|nr:hypothetical protein [Acidobacteriota bacterium]
LCFAPEQWLDRAHAITSAHLPLLYGGVERPLAHYGVHTDVIAGHAWVTPVVVTLVASGIVCGVWTLAKTRGARHPAPPATSHELGWYLVLVGVSSIAGYGLANCNPIDILTLRYDLLAMMVPVGAVALALSSPAHTIVKVVIGLAVVLWAAANLRDINGVTWQYRHAEPADMRQIAADVLVARGVPAAWAEFRIAYHISYLSRERIKVAASDVGRIDEYAELARAPGTPTIAGVACAKGQEIAIGVYLCPP